MSLKRLGKCTEQPVLSLEGMTNEPLNLVKHVQDATVDTKISKLKRDTSLLNLILFELGNNSATYTFTISHPPDWRH